MIVICTYICPRYISYIYPHIYTECPLDVDIDIDIDIRFLYLELSYLILILDIDIGFCIIVICSKMSTYIYKMST